jgi:hypothetical protein
MSTTSNVVSTRSLAGRATQSPEPYRSRAGTVAEEKSAGGRFVAAGWVRVAVVGMAAKLRLRPMGARRWVTQ